MKSRWHPYPAVGFVLLAGLARAASGAGGAAQPPVVYEAQKLSAEEFRRLPDDAVVNVRGTRMTARDIRAKSAQESAAVKAAHAALMDRARTKAAETAAQFNREQAAKLSATNAASRATFARLLQFSPAKPVAGAVTAKLAVADPVITNAPAAIQPGSLVTIEGTSLGSAPGSVVLKGLPDGDHSLPMESGTVWLDWAVQVVVPSELGKLFSQQATLEVVRKDGRRSAPRSVRFETDTAMAVLDFAILRKCANAATDNDCPFAEWTFGGVHREDTLWESGAAACDAWSVALVNGWTIHHAEGHTQMGSAADWHKAPAGSATWDFEVCWSVPGGGSYSNSATIYHYDVFITGPKSLPWGAFSFGAPMYVTPH